MRKLSHDEIRRLSREDLSSAERHPVTCILHDIRSAHNVGSIFRSADAARIERIILSGFTPDPDHKGVRKAALGAVEFVPWERTGDVQERLSDLHRTGWTTAALEITDTPTDPRTLGAEHFPVAILVGNEVDGVPDEMIERCDIALELPQFGAKQSLNVSVATGIALYDVVRTYRSLKR